MAQGLSIHVGLNSVDPNHYNGWSGKLQACEADAKDMARIAGERDFESTTISRSFGSLTIISGRIRPSSVAMVAC